MGRGVRSWGFNGVEGCPQNWELLSGLVSEQIKFLFDVITMTLFLTLFIDSTIHCAQ